MKKPLKLGCVVMAAGNARRFGENKLAAQLRGRSLILRTLETVPPEVFENVVVVTQYPEIMRLAGEFRFSAVYNEHPDYGISHTIELGLTALRDCDGVCFLVSDQPLLRRESVAALARCWKESPDKLAALGHGGVRGNPCIFPARFYQELLELREDHGGSTVIRSKSEYCRPLFSKDSKALCIQSLQICRPPGRLISLPVLLSGRRHI